MVHLSPISSTTAAGLGVEVVAVGVAAFITPTVGVFIAALGVLFFFPLLTELFSQTRKPFIWASVICLFLIITLVGLYISLSDSSPATYVELKDAVPVYPVFQPGDTTKINVIFVNKGPFHARDVIWASDLIMRHESITEALEDAAFDDFIKNHKGSTPMDLSVGNEFFRTIETRMLNKREADDLQEGRTRLYVMGFTRYQDKNGHHEHQFCRWLQPPRIGLPSVWHFCAHHNRTN